MQWQISLGYGAPMLREHDERAKLIAEQTLDALGEVRREVEVPTSDAQRMDLWFRRLHSLPQRPAYLELLDVLFPVDCIIEAFGQAVSLLAFWESHRKQYGWRRHLQQQARALAEAAGEAVVPVPPPFLWVLSAGRPDSLFDEYRIVPRPGCPAGIYDWDRGWRIGLIVVGELPPGKATLLLRLMGSPAVRQIALLEVKQLPESDPDKAMLRRIVAALRHTLRHAKNIDEEEREEFMTTAWADFENYERGLQQEAHKDGFRAAVLDLCEVFGIVLNEEQKLKLARMDVPALESLRAHLKLYHAWPAQRG